MIKETGLKIHTRKHFSKIPRNFKWR